MTLVAPTPSVVRGFPRAVVIILGLAGRAVVVAGLRSASGIVAPLVLALAITITFLSLIFWSWVLGPLGALLAVPMSLLVRAVFLDADPDSNWRRPLVSNRADAPPGSTNRDAAGVPGRDDVEVTCADA
jgi:hypothetical protein